MSKKATLKEGIYASGLVPFDIPPGLYTVIEETEDRIIIDRNELKPGQKLNIIKLDKKRFTF